VLDTDTGGWTEWSEAHGGYVWREDRIEQLLSEDAGSTLYVSGTVSNQGRFYPHFDAVVLLSAPADVLITRIERRTTNDYGKTAEQRAVILRQLVEVEPLLRATSTHELDATQPVNRVVERLVEIGGGCPADRRSLAPLSAPLAGRTAEGVIRSERGCGAADAADDGEEKSPLDARILDQDAADR
jgi:hypothetical protein